MSRRPSSSLYWLTLAVVLPLVVLIVIAWVGLRAQARSAWSDKEKEAAGSAENFVTAFATTLRGKIHEFELYPDPPVPGKASPTDQILDGSDISALVTLRDSPGDERSSSGVPYRMLAALRVHRLAPERMHQLPGERSRFIRLATVEAPSILSELALSELAPLDHAEVATWENQKVAASLLRRRPEGGWFENGDDFWWVEPNGKDKVRYLSDVVESSISKGSLKSGDGRTLRIMLEDAWNARKFGDAISGAAPVPFGSGLIAVVTFPAEDVRQSIQRQQAVIVLVLVFASGVSLFGLFFLQRTLRRERQLNEMKSQFVASVSHELRAPVASIRLMADALEAEKVAPETAKEFHRLIAREGARLSTLVGNVLDHARIEQGRKVWRMESCDLCSLVADTVRVMEPLAREKGIALKQQLSTVEAVVDADAIQQALVNLLDNAIKFSPQGTTVTTALTIDEERRIWCLSVRDEGPGIPKEEQLRIFERFYRPGNELRRETQGTGIGLSLVKSIAEAHHGTVSVESERRKGSTFTLSGSAGLRAGTLDHSCRSEDRRSREES